MLLFILPYFPRPPLFVIPAAWEIPSLRPADDDAEHAPLNDNTDDSKANEMQQESQ